MGSIRVLILSSLALQLLISCGNTGLEPPEVLQEEKVSEIPSDEPAASGLPRRLVSSRFAGLSSYHGKSEHFQINGAGFSEYAYDLDALQSILDEDLLTAAQLGVER